MISGVLVVLAILLAPYLRPWLAQRSQISAGRLQVGQLQRQVDQLETEQKQWQDPDYVRAQARERLNFVMPGDTGYVLLPAPPPAVQSDPRKQAAAAAGAVTGRPWYDVVWQSVQLAGSAPAGTTAP